MTKSEQARLVAWRARVLAAARDKARGVAGTQGPRSACLIVSTEHSGKAHA